MGQRPCKAWSSPGFEPSRLHSPTDLGESQRIFVQRTMFVHRDGVPGVTDGWGGPSPQGPSQALSGVELVQQLPEGFLACPAGDRHGLKIDRRLHYRAYSAGAINLPPPRLRWGRPVLHDGSGCAALAVSGDVINRVGRLGCPCRARWWI
jgi:hypothetical protein